VPDRWRHHGGLGGACNVRTAAVPLLGAGEALAGASKAPERANASIAIFQVPASGFNNESWGLRPHSTGRFKFYRPRLYDAQTPRGTACANRRRAKGEADVGALLADAIVPMWYGYAFEAIHVVLGTALTATVLGILIYH
jgi:hypothetical protein